MGFFEILLLLAIALIVIPPDDLPQVMRTAGKLLRELRLASNTVMRELSSAIGDEPPYNLLPPRFDDPLPPPPPVAAPAADSTAAATALEPAAAPSEDAPPASPAAAAQPAPPAEPSPADIKP